MKVRRLEADEFEQLRICPDGLCPGPDKAIAGIAKDGDAIVGRIFLAAPAHMEGPWVDESYRGGTLAARLVKWAEQEAKRSGLTKLFAYGFSPELEDYLERLGYTRQPVTVWTKEL